MHLRVEDAFVVTGRGLVVVGQGSLGPIAAGALFEVEIVRPDRSTMRGMASKEWLLVSVDPPLEREAILIRGTRREEIPPGSVVHLSGPHP